MTSPLRWFMLHGVGLSLCYAEPRQVDYQWRWERVPQYLVATEGEIPAPFDGTVTLAEDGKSSPSRAQGRAR